jgi:hypothetical protein
MYNFTGVSGTIYPIRCNFLPQTQFHSKYNYKCNATQIPDNELTYPKLDTDVNVSGPRCIPFITLIKSHPVQSLEDLMTQLNTAQRKLETLQAQHKHLNPVLSYMLHQNLPVQVPQLYV